MSVKVSYQEKIKQWKLVIIDDITKVEICLAWIDQNFKCTTFSMITSEQYKTLKYVVTTIDKFIAQLKKGDVFINKKQTKLRL